jgi:hypothetical protein
MDLLIPTEATYLRKPDVKLRRSGVTAVENLREKYVWPKGCGATLPEVFAQSYKPVRRYLHNTNKMFQKWITEWEHGGEVPAYASFNIAKGTSIATREVSDFLELLWFPAVNEEVCTWDGWKGNLSYYIWSFNHRLFDRIVQQANTEYFGSFNEHVFKQWKEKVSK